MSFCFIQDQENKQCGYGIRKEEHEGSRHNVIYTRGCVEGFAEWVERNIIMIGAIALGIALIQVRRNYD